ncbi:hypothetical protein [Streptomyces sp. NPDC058657]|uniref:hypothetical protein n=1 Tax=unclassified Streptomyces TaxID=2593676 RepID=UPI00365290B3
MTAPPAAAARALVIAPLTAASSAPAASATPAPLGSTAGLSPSSVRTFLVVRT